PLARNRSNAASRTIVIPKVNLPLVARAERYLRTRARAPRAASQAWKGRRRRYARVVLLYDSRVSGNCYKVRLLLAHLGLAYERREVDVVDRSARHALLGELNPGLRVPTVVLDDGRALGESDAILFYFAAGTAYLPDEAFARAQVLQWMFFEQYSHEPNIAVLRFWALHPDAATPADADVRARRAGGAAALEALGRHLDARGFPGAGADT